MSATPSEIHRLTYEEMDELVRRYKEGDRQATEILIQQFSPLFNKYARLIKGDPSPHLYNYDTYQFLGLLCARHQAVRYDIRSIAIRLATITENLDYEDVYQELVRIFLECLERYKFHDANIGSLGYIVVRFRWEVKDWLNSLAASTRTPPLPITSLTTSEGGQMDVEINQEEYSGLQEEYTGLSEMDLAWVHNTDDPLFSRLTPYHRYLLYLNFKKNMGLRAIGQALGRNKDTIRQHLQEIMATLRAWVNETSNST